VLRLSQPCKNGDGQCHDHVNSVVERPAIDSLDYRKLELERKRKERQRCLRGRGRL
jgi:hypothetical protein